MRALLLLALLSVHALAVAFADRKFGKLVQRDAPVSVLSVVLTVRNKQTCVCLCMCVFSRLYTIGNNEVNHNSGLACRA